MAFPERKMVEVAGVEPACRLSPVRTSTCLFHLCCLSSSAKADEQAWIQTILSCNLTSNRKTLFEARALNDAANFLALLGNRSVAETKPPLQTLCRSRLSFRPMFYEANDHPRHAINTQPGRSNPEHPQSGNSQYICLSEKVKFRTVPKTQCRAECGAHRPKFRSVFFPPLSRSFTPGLCR